MLHIEHDAFPLHFPSENKVMCTAQSFECIWIAFEMHSTRKNTQRIGPSFHSCQFKVIQFINRWIFKLRSRKKRGKIVAIDRFAIHSIRPQQIEFTVRYKFRFALFNSIDFNQSHTTIKAKRVEAHDETKSVGFYHSAKHIPFSLSKVRIIVIQVQRFILFTLLFVFSLTKKKINIE